MAATDERATTFRTFVDEAYGEYTSLTMDGERGVRTLATAFLGDNLPLRDSGLVTRGIPSTDVAGSILREAHSIVAIRPTARDKDTRYVTNNPDGDIVLGSALLVGGPFGKTVGERFASEETSELVSAIQRIASRTTRGGESLRVPNIIHSKGLARYTGNILSPSALLGIVARDADSAIRVAEIHPGYGELLLASALTETVTYRGLETDSDLLPERYEPKAGSIPPRDDIRGVLDVVAPPSDPERVILTNDPDELGEDPYDVVVIRQPRDDSEIALATRLVKPDGVLVVIPGETPRSPGGLVGAILSGPLSGMSNPEVIGIQTLTQEFVGAIVYRPSGEESTAEVEPVVKSVPKVSFDKIGKIPFVNAGKDRIPAVILTARAAMDAGAECIVLRAPRHIIPSGVAAIATKMTGVQVYLVDTDEDVLLVSNWLKTKGIRVMTEQELVTSGALTNTIRTVTNNIITSQNKRRPGKYSRPSALVVYGTCQMLVTSIAEAFPEASISIVIPPRDVITHTSMNALVRRGYGKVKLHQMNPGESPMTAIANAIKASSATVVWNASWGKHHTV